MMMLRKGQGLLMLGAILLFGIWTTAGGAENDWPQLQHDAQHTGYSPEVIEAPDGFGTGWQLSFLGFTPYERISRVVQVVAADDKLFVPTQSGNLYALDPADGKVIWQFPSGEPVMHSAAFADGRVFFATIKGSVFAVDSKTGEKIWQWNNGLRTGFSAAVCLADGKVFIGGRGGDFHAIDQGSGKEVWAYQAGAPIYQTAAYSDGTVFFCGEDMYCYALAATNGAEQWKSDKLSGSSFRDFYPLVHKGVVIVESMPAWQNQGGQYWFDGVKFPLTGWWRFEHPGQVEWVKKYGLLVQQGQIPPEAMKDIIAAQDYQIKHFEDQPEDMLRFALDVKTGKQPYVLPLFIQAMCGDQQPPAVERSGKLVMPVTFGRCGWGSLDLDKQRITDIYFEMGSINGRDYQTGHGGCSGDENICQSAAGPWVFIVHVGEHGPGPGPIDGHPAAYTGSYNLDQRKWYTMPSLSRERNVRRSGSHSTNAQCGANPPSIAYGAVYHQMSDTVHCWVPKK